LESEGKSYIIAFYTKKRKIIVVRRTLNKNEKGLMLDDSPPSIFHTSDDIEWAFLQTLPDYDTFNKFRLKSNCKHRGDASEKSTRIRCYCIRRLTQAHCKFMLLGLKTTKQRYHVYSLGEHDHSMQKIKSE
jgi:hypothetical protein